MPESLECTCDRCPYCNSQNLIIHFDEDGNEIGSEPCWHCQGDGLEYSKSCPVHGHLMEAE